VVANFADFVGKTNTEDDYYSAYNFYKPILSVQGSRDSFRYKVLPFMGGSDHKIYNDRLVHVPMIFFNVWPDPYYESNMDTPDNCDPTTLRRGAVVAVASAVFTAKAAGTEALKLVSEIYSRGLGRISRDINKALEYLNTSEGERLATAYKEADIVVRHSFAREKEAFNTVLPLAPEDEALAKYVTELRACFDIQKEGVLRDIGNHYRILCGRSGLRPIVPKLNPEELEAQKMVPVRNDKLRGPLGVKYVIEKSGANPLLGVSSLFRDERVLYEVFNYCDGTRSILEIRNAASAEFAPIPLTDVKSFFEALAKSDVIRLTTTTLKK
jgi:hypothetical protein